MEILEWFKKHGRYMNISEIEKIVGCPKNTLRKFINGERTLADKWRYPIEVFVKGMSWYEKAETGSMKSFEEDDIKVIFPGETTKIDNIVVVANGKEPVLKILEEVPFKNDTSTVDISTGEIKDNLIPVRLKWLFNRVDSVYDNIEPWISKSGNLFEVKKMFGSIAKYIYVDNLEDARRIVQSKNPLLVELSK